MSALVRKRGRLVRVRHVQHVLAVGAAAAARDRAGQIADNARRLAMVRDELFEAAGPVLAGRLAAQRELADRLLVAGRQLDGALSDARRRVDGMEAAVVAADREREIAERLKGNAVRAADDRAEARIAALPLNRRVQAREAGEP